MAISYNDHGQVVRAGVKCEVRGGKMRGTGARRRVICEAGNCEAQRTTGAAGVVI